MRLRTRLAVAACKLSGAVLRAIGWGGTNLPGRLAMRIDANLLDELSETLRVIVVTGVNGKTTTVRMIGQALQDAGIKYFSNRSGANMITGIAAEFARHTKLFGRGQYTHALIECDEAAFSQVSGKLPIECLVVSNIFRDQTERFGEMPRLLGMIEEGILKNPHAVLCLNADCSLTVSLAEWIPNKVIWFGVSVPFENEDVKEISDSASCIRCGAKYVYDFTTYGHLGGFKCVRCGYKRPEPEVEVTKVTHSCMYSSEAVFRVGGYSDSAYINQPGVYNIYNGAAAVAACRALGMDTEIALGALGHFECAFGRGEQFTIGKTKTCMVLVKNPVGFNQTIKWLLQRRERCQLVFILNDRFADGIDISWIWDVDFEALAAVQQRYSRIIVAGIRKDDLLLRLKYAGFSQRRIEVVQNSEEVVRTLYEDNTPAFVIPNYTAMLKIRKDLSRRIKLKAFYR